MTSYTVSIIIPTHNRSASLLRLLGALSKQTYSLEQIEVIVVANGCTDGTPEILRQLQTSFKLKIIEQSDQGPAGARNNGAAFATGQLLIFLDDDIEPTSSLVESFVTAHTDSPGKVALGYLPPHMGNKRDFLSQELRRWWEDKFNAMREPGHRFRYHDMLSGNFCIQSDKFRRIAGFDTNFRSCLDDSEFGFRLLKSGETFIFIEDAKGYHYETRNLRGMFIRKYNEGHAEVLLGQKHPELKSVLFLSQIQKFSTLVRHVLFTSAFHFSTLDDLGSEVFHKLLGVLEWMRLRRPWRFILDISMIYWYMRGAADKLGSKKAFFDFLNAEFDQEKEFASIIEINLAEGFDCAETRIDQECPNGLVIRYGKHKIGTLDPVPGLERLRGDHLRLILAKYFPIPILMALAHEGLIDEKFGAVRLIALGDEFLSAD